MSAVTTVPRHAVRLGLAVLGVPARLAGSPPALDRADAAIRETAGRLLGDDALVQDAERKRAAADARDRAVNLEEDAAARRTKAAEQRQEREADAQELAARRKKAARSRADDAREAAEKQERRERAKAITEREQALDAREEAQRKADEADRLAKAADTAKAVRKAT